MTPASQPATRAVLLALPGLSLAAAGLFHPEHLTYATSTRWWTLHLPGLVVFPLVGLSLVWLVRGRVDPLSWVVRLTAYGYMTFYSALDVVNGIAAGYVTHRLGAGVPRPPEISYLFRIGSPLGEIGSWSLLACCLALLADAVVRRGGAVAVVAGAGLVVGAWLVRTDHIFSPVGVVGMTLLGVFSAAYGVARSESRLPGAT